MASIRGGEKLAQRLREIVKSAGRKELRAGFLDKGPYDNGPKVAQVAFWNEFGHGGPFPAPPRPFFRTAVEEHKGEWSKKLAAALPHFNFDAVQAMSAVGDVIRGDIQQSIISTSEPRLSPTTIMLRNMFGNNPQEIRARDVIEAQRKVADGEDPGGASTKPLVWTGHMLNSVDYEVK